MADDNYFDQAPKYTPKAEPWPEEPPEAEGEDEYGDVRSFPGGEPLGDGPTIRVKRNKEGQVLPTISNILILFAQDPVLQGMLTYDSFACQPLITRAPPPVEEGEPGMPGPYPRPWSDPDAVLILAYIQRTWAARASLQSVEAAMITEAQLRPHHPVADWLSTLKWDGVARIDTWLSAAFDCADGPFARAVAPKLLIAAVRRIRQPGCKFDQMVILEGAQGIGKSRALRALFGEHWFSDSIPPDLADKDAAMALTGVWCLEFAEIEHLIRAEVETIKAFLSRSVDRYRPPYGRAYVERPRQGVLIGTTNSDDYLRDTTGNRRIWPIKCRTADPEWITLNREQLWAEASVREANGEAIWLDDDTIHADALAAQADRMVSDTWSEAVADFVIGRIEVTVTQVLIDGLGIPRERMTRGTEMRVAGVLRQMGWTRRRERLRGAQLSIWRAPGHDLFDAD